MHIRKTQDYCLENIVTQKRRKEKRTFKDTNKQTKQCQALILFEGSKTNISVEIQSNIQVIYYEKGKAVSLRYSHVCGDISPETV